MPGLHTLKHKTQHWDPTGPSTSYDHAFVVEKRGYSQIHWVFFIAKKRLQQSRVTPKNKSWNSRTMMQWLLQVPNFRWKYSILFKLWSTGILHTFVGIHHHCLLILVNKHFCNIVSSHNILSHKLMTQSTKMLNNTLHHNNSNSSPPITMKNSTNLLNQSMVWYPSNSKRGGTRSHCYYS